MNDHHHDQQQWGECPSGELHSLARRLRAQHSRRRAVKVSQYGALGLVVIGAFFVTSGLINARRVPAVLAHLNCRECHEHFEAYHLHLAGTQPMDVQLAERMRAHLLHCKRCRLAFEKQYPDVAIAALDTATQPLASERLLPVESATLIFAVAALR